MSISGDNGTTTFISFYENGSPMSCKDMEPRTGTRCRARCPTHNCKCEVVQPPQDMRELTLIVTGREHTFAHDVHLCIPYTGLDAGKPHTFEVSA